MPELPEVALYLHALRARVLGERLKAVRIPSPSLLKSFDPPIAHAHRKVVESLSRLGKRVVFGLEDDLFIVIHLMIAGRFQWRKPGAPIHRKQGHAALDFPHGSLHLTEAGSHKRASLHLVRGEAGLGDHDPGGIEPLDAAPEDFAAALRRENRTLKRALTDPRILSGMGAFHLAMSAHGKYGEPCPRCGTPIQRIVYATRETNYCPDCQTGGRLLADRALSRLLRQDWPRRLEDLEALKRR